MRIRSVLSVFALVALSMMVLSCCDWCDTDTPEPEDHTTIYLPHEYVAAWMSLTNKFHTDEATEGEEGEEGEDHADEENWTGLLFQLGNYVGVGDGAYEVKIEAGSGDETYLLASQKIWVNVVADATAEPMDQDDLKYLWPDPDSPSACEAVDACADDACLCTSPPCETTDLVEIPKECLRNRTLHRDFTVLGVLTYWNGQQGYTLETERKDEHHLEHEFSLNDPVRVEVWELNTGGTLIKAFDLSDVTKISIQEAGTITHGLHESPPWPGFGL